MNTQKTLTQSAFFGIEKLLEEMARMNDIDSDIERSLLSMMSEVQVAISSLERILDATDYCI